TESVYHMFVIRLQTPEMRESLAASLKAVGIETGVHYPVPNHQQPAITELYGTLPKLPKTENYVKRILSLPMYPDMTDEQVGMVVSTIRTALRG
ncbi:MAG: DegT/DnrJ/EryC1/StrS family aminotransferase, partial [Phycisphaerae bacterium]|nr:DegT/DnrJ/EryC1/StrS family aminotransferase [Phycisphaerae bacterium]